jgi:hypothetical protein
MPPAELPATLTSGLMGLLCPATRRPLPTSDIDQRIDWLPTGFIFQKKYFLKTRYCVLKWIKKPSKKGQRGGVVKFWLCQPNTARRIGTKQRNRVKTLFGTNRHKKPFFDVCGYLQYR